VIEGQGEMSGEQGWYPDEADPSKIRWWSGQAWAAESQDRPAGYVDPRDVPRSTVHGIHPGIDSAAISAETRVEGTVSSRRHHVLPWLVGVPVLLFVVFMAPANPALTVSVVGAVAVLTGVWTLASNRPSWAKLDRRWKGATPLALGVALLALATVLPTSFVISPIYLSAPPRPTQEQADALVRDWTVIEPRIAVEWPTDHVVTRAMEVCVVDQASQTPDQELERVRTGFVFESGTVTPAQTRALLEVVRGNFCGQPGDRPELDTVYTLPDLVAVLFEAMVEKAD
jgi:hypothetical protein